MKKTRILAAILCLMMIVCSLPIVTSAKMMADDYNAAGALMGKVSSSAVDNATWKSMNLDFTNNFSDTTNVKTTDASGNAIDFTEGGFAYDNTNGLAVTKGDYRVWRYFPAGLESQGWSPLVFGAYYLRFKLEEGGTLEPEACAYYQHARSFVQLSNTGVTVWSNKNNDGLGANGQDRSVVANTNDYVPGTDWNQMVVVANGGSASSANGYSVYLKKDTDAQYTLVASTNGYRGGGAWRSTGLGLGGQGYAVSDAVMLEGSDILAVDPYEEDNTPNPGITGELKEAIGSVLGAEYAAPATSSSDWPAMNLDFTGSFDASQDGVNTGAGITYDAVDGVVFPAETAASFRYRPTVKYNGWSPLCISSNYSFNFKLDPDGTFQTQASKVWSGDDRVYIDFNNHGVTVWGRDESGQMIVEKLVDYKPGTSWNDVVIKTNTSGGYDLYMKKATESAFTLVNSTTSYRPGNAWNTGGFLAAAKNAKMGYAVSWVGAEKPVEVDNTPNPGITGDLKKAIGKVLGAAYAAPAVSSADWPAMNLDFTGSFDASQDGVTTGSGITYDAVDGVVFPGTETAFKYRPTVKYNGWSPLCISGNYTFRFKLDSNGTFQVQSPQVWNNNRVYVDFTKDSVTVWDGGAEGGGQRVSPNLVDYKPGIVWNDVMVTTNAAGGYDVYMKKATDAEFTKVNTTINYRVGNGAWSATGFSATAKNAKMGYAVSWVGAEDPAAEAEKYLTYTISGGEATITGCDKEVVGSLVIPSTLGGCPVTTIGKSAFAWCTGLNDITIPESVTTINFRAFERCTNLTDITIPESVATIGSDAFYYCSGLKNINVDADNANYCSVSGVLFDKAKKNLICYPAGKTEAEYTIPDGVTTIGSEAFFYGTSLKTVNISASVETIDCTALCYSPELENINVAAGNTAYHSVAGILFDEAQTTLICFPAGNFLKEYTVPGGVTTIGDRAFYNCGNLTAITMPESVTTIGMEAFACCEGLTGITIGEKVEIIGDYAFSHCPDLRSITIPASVTTIGNYVFDYCDELKEVYYAGTQEEWEAISVGKGNDSFVNATILYNVSREAGSYLTYTVSGDEATIVSCDTQASGGLVIPSTLGGYPVTAIGDYAFYGCDGLTGVAIPETVTTIGEYAFGLCTGLNGLHIPDGVTCIGDFAFYGCEGMESISIHQTVSSIGSMAFANCTGLTEIAVATNNETYSSLDGSLYDKNQEILICYPAGKVAAEYSVPANVTVIAEGAINGCVNLTTINIPASVTVMGQYMFYNCEALTDINVDAENPAYSSLSGVLYDKNQETLICYPAGRTIAEYRVKDGVTAIAEGAFYTAKVASVIIPDGVTEIGDSAFYACEELANISLPESVTAIPEFAFYGCTGLTGIDLPETVTEIGSSAFYGSGLTTITIPDGVAILPTYAFRDCADLESVILPDGLTTIGENAFCNCTKLSEIVIPDSVTAIDGFAFYGCEGLSDITIPEEVTEIGNSAFFGCSGLTAITIPENVASLGDWVFGWCTGLEVITFEKSVTTIGDYAFYNCPAFREVRFIGSPAEWEAISVGANNEDFIAATVRFVGKTKTTVSNDGKTFRVTPINIETGKIVILGLYKNGVLVDTQQIVCRNDDVTFETQATYNKAMVMVWDNMQTQLPICEPELVK